MIKKNDQVLVLRYISYEDYDFIKEHQTIIDKTDSVWLFKFGKQVSRVSAEKVINNGGHLLLRQPKKDGGKLYYSKILGFMNGKFTKDMSFPDYYFKAKLGERVGWLEGSWFKINQMKEVPEEFYNHFKMIKNDKLINDVLNETRTSVLLAYSDKDIVI